MSPYSHSVQDHLYIIIEKECCLVVTKGKQNAYTLHRTLLYIDGTELAQLLAETPITKEYFASRTYFLVEADTLWLPNEVFSEKEVKNLFELSFSLLGKKIIVTPSEEDKCLAISVEDSLYDILFADQSSTIQSGVCGLSQLALEQCQRSKLTHQIVVLEEDDMLYLFACTSQDVILYNRYDSNNVSENGYYILNSIEHLGWSGEEVEVFHIGERPELIQKIDDYVGQTSRVELPQYLSEHISANALLCGL